MRMLDLPNKSLVCEVCSQNIHNPATIGFESDQTGTWPIRLCHRCGPIDIDLMQLCREITVGCMNH
jgi:hypothetical protein